MPLFAFIGHDVPDSGTLRVAHRPAHLAGLEALDAAGRIRFAGPILDAEGSPLGSVILFEADDRSAAETIAARDAYVTGGVFAHYEVRETRATFPRS